MPLTPPTAGKEGKRRAGGCRADLHGLLLGIPCKSTELKVLGLEGTNPEGAPMPSDAM
jgi:hypothetical protein